MGTIYGATTSTLLTRTKEEMFGLQIAYCGNKQHLQSELNRTLPIPHKPLRVYDLFQINKERQRALVQEQLAQQEKLKAQEQAQLAQQEKRKAQAQEKNALKQHGIAESTLVDLKEALANYRKANFFIANTYRRNAGGVRLAFERETLTMVNDMIPLVRGAERKVLVESKFFLHFVQQQFNLANEALEETPRNMLESLGPISQKYANKTLAEISRIDLHP